MTKSFDQIVSNYQDPQPEWTVSINGKNYSNNIELIEFTDSVNNPLKVTVKLDGIDSNDEIPEDAEVIIGRKSAQLFRGVLKEVNPNAYNSYTFKGTGYAAELESNSEQILTDEGVGERFQDSTVQTVVDTLVDGASMPNSRTFSTSYSGGIASTVVDDFRVKKKQIEDVNRLMGEYDIEWYTTTDGSDNPVFNVTDQISFTDGGNPIDTITTYGGNQSAEMVEQNVNRNKGDFDGVVVRGYGDGDDQITASAGSTGKGNRVLFYTDKTILTDSQAQKRADNLADTQTVAWQEIEVKPSNPNNVYGVGDELKIESKEARLNDTYRVVKTYFKIWPGEDQFESKLNLSNKPQTFIDDFKEQQNQTDSQTDYMQGARNVWGDKEAANATNAEPLEIDFEVPQDVVDVAENNRLDRVELNYACTSYRQSGDPQDVTASNFDPSTKVVSTEVEPAGIEMERSNIKNHNHPVGSSTSFGGSGRGFLDSSTGFSFSNTVPSSGWVRVGGQQLIPSNPENDLKHRIKIDIGSISSTTDLHYAILSSNPVANFRWNPLSPVPGEQVSFEDTSSEPVFGGSIQEWQWDFGDGTTETITSSPGDTTHTYSSAGVYTVTLEIYDGSSNLLDSISQDVEIISASSLSSEEFKQKIENNEQFKNYLKNSSPEKIKTQDAGTWDHLLPDDGEMFWIDDGGDVDVSFFSEFTDAGETNVDLEFFLQKENNTSYYEFQNVDENIDPSNGYDFLRTVNFDEFDDYPFGDDFYNGGPGDTDGGPQGEYSWSFRQDGIVENVDRTFVVGSAEITDINEFVNPDGDDPSEVKLDVEGWAGGSTKDPFTGDQAGDWIDTVELYVDGNQEKTWDVRGSTADIEEGETQTVYFGIGAETVELVDVIDDNTAEFNGSVKGSNTTLDEGEISNDAHPFAAAMFYGCRFVADAYDIVDRDGNDTGTTFSGAVVETYIDTDEGDVSYQASGFSEGSHDYEFRFVDNANDTRVTDSGSFTIDLNDPPTSDFSFSPTNPDAFETVNFTDLSSDPDSRDDVVEWQWDFGDGTTQTIDPAWVSVDEQSLTTVTINGQEVTLEVVDVSTPESEVRIGGATYFAEDGELVETVNGEDIYISKFRPNANPPYLYFSINQPLVGDTTHSYNSGGTYSVSLTVSDTSGASDTETKDITVGDSQALENTVEYSGVRNVGASSSSVSSQVIANANTVDFSGVSNVGTQTSPANDSFFVENIEIPYRDISTGYEVYVASQGGGSPDITGNITLQQINHKHDVPRQDDFGGADADVGAGAENKEIAYQRAVGNRGDVLLDFSSVDEAVTLDTTINGNDVTITVANIDSISKSIVSVDAPNNVFSISGDETNVLDVGETVSVNGSTSNDGDYTISSFAYDGSNTNITVQEDFFDSTADGTLSATVTTNDETISANNGTATTTNTYQDDELYLEIDSANNNDEFEVRNQSSTSSFRLAAAAENRFRSAKSAQQTDGVSSDDGSTQAVVEDVDSDLLAGTTANNVRIFIDDDPDGAGNEQEITGDLYGGSPDSGTPKDKELDISDYVDSPGWYRLKIVPDQASFIKSRVFLDHHKDTE